MRQPFESSTDSSEVAEVTSAGSIMASYIARVARRAHDFIYETVAPVPLISYLVSKPLLLSIHSNLKSTQWPTHRTSLAMKA